VDPKNPNVVYASSLGHVFKSIPNAASSRRPTAARRGRRFSSLTTTPARAISSWTRTIRDVVRRDVAGAARAVETDQRRPGQRSLQTTDGGAHWTKISSNPGFATGLLGTWASRFGDQPPQRLRDRAGEGRRRVPLHGRRQDVEARERRDEGCASAPSTTWQFSPTRRIRTSRTYREVDASLRRPTAAARGER